MAEVTQRPISLLEALRAGAGFEAALLLTFGAYFPFVEEVIWRRLRASGCHYVVVLMDSGQLALELGDKLRRPTGAGRRYGLLPIVCRNAFHPKVALLVGPKNARVLIGSHNLTMSGFMRNREVTNVIDVGGPKDRVGAAAVVEVLEFCTAWGSSLAPPLKRAIEDFRNVCRTYLGPSPEGTEVDVIGSRPDGPSLWQRVRRRLPDAVKRVAILGPFFDQELAFVRRVMEDLRPEELTIGVDPETVSFPGNTKRLPRGVRVVDAHDLDPGHEGRGYLHAKAILIQGDSKQVLITGSANPSAAAWLAPAGSRNAEIVVVRHLAARSTEDLGLARLWKEREVAPRVLAKMRTRPERADGSKGASHAPLIGVCEGTRVVIEGSFREVVSVVIRDLQGVELASSTRKTATQLIVEVRERVHDASSIEARLDGALRHGFVHHIDLLREAAVSSSQRRFREALSGLGGDPSQLEGLLKLIEKVIFEAAPVETEVSRKGRNVRGPKDADLAESTVALVSTLNKAHAQEVRHLSTGDLGLLLDYLMRKLWQSLSHESSLDIRPETELIDSEDEDLLQELPSDEEIAAAWHRKSRTLLRRLSRRIEESSNAPQIIIESAAVLGILEALRRVEDQDRWRRLRLEFVDREAAAEFVFVASPRLFMPQTGLFDVAAKRAGAPFSEQQGLIEWATWLAWLTGFGGSYVWVEEDQDEADAAIDAAERLARECLIGARAALADRARIIELLEASPFPGADSRSWLDSLTRLGEVYRNPTAAAVLKRGPRSGDLALTLNGTGPYVVRCVRGDKVDLIDFGRENETATFLASKVRLLDTGLEPKRRAVGW